MATTFSEKGEAALKTCDPRLQRAIRLARSWCDGLVEFDITQGARTIEQQREYFKGGRSKVDPDAYDTPEKLYAAAKHIVGPGMQFSRAVDIHIVTKQPGGAYDKQALCYVAGVIMVAAKGYGLKLRWGGDFDRDNELLEAGSFQDLPHFEIDQK